MRISKALIVAEPWIGHLLAGQKTWEMRSQSASHRGWFGLIRKGSGTVVGVARLLEVGQPLSQHEMLATIDKHCIPAEMILNGEVAKWNTPWKLADVRKLLQPVPYRHKSGAVTWVDLNEEVASAIAQQLGDAGGTMVTTAGFERGRNEEVKVDIRQRGSKVYIDVQWDDGLPYTGLPATPLAPPQPETLREPGKLALGVSDRFVGEACLTAGNIRNGHIYLRSFFDRFPEDAVGGSNKASMAQRLLTVETSEGDNFETDLDGSKKFFRARGSVRAFLEASRARAGDTVLVEQLAPYRYRISLQR